MYQVFPVILDNIKRHAVIVCVNVVVTLVLFVAINLGAALYLRSKSHSRDVDPWALSDANRAAKARAYESAGLSDRRAELDQVPPVRLHPRLAIVSGLSTSAYRLGIANIRYEPDWEDPWVQARLDARPTLLLGGSTVFGVGVPGDQTLGAALNRSGQSSTHLNLGVLAYDSNEEIERLVYLLRQGYRPGRVVFVDGLNDLGYGLDTTVAEYIDVGGVDVRSRSPLLDVGVPGAPSASGLVRALLYSLPVYHLMIRATKGVDAHGRFEPIDPNVDAWDANLAAYVRTVVRGKDPVWIADRWVRYYSRQIAFVEGLARSFDFQVEFILQPVGVGDPTSHFDVPDELYSYETRALEVIRAAIASGVLRMRDCSEVFVEDRKSRDPEQALYYIDPTHYSPLGNELLAGCIARQASTVAPASGVDSSPRARDIPTPPRPAGP